MRVAGETLLNCSMREGGAWVVRPPAELPEAAQAGDTHVAELVLAEDTRLLVGVRHLSPTGRHRFRLPVARGGRRPRAACPRRSSASRRCSSASWAPTRPIRGPCSTASTPAPTP